MIQRVDGGFGLYLHWPFCAAKCPYCDFNSHVTERIDWAAWEAAYLSEIARAGRETEGRLLETVFLGGGTPSLMRPELVASILAAVQRTWTCANDLEVTLEANPGSVEVGRFEAYRQAGVSRVSIGVQALNDADLRKLGRVHDAAEARNAIEIGMRVFDRVSFDLIYARQDQDVTAWEAELRAALAYGTGHLSLYQLTIEPGTVFARRHAARRLPGLPDEDRAVALWERTQELCGAAGLSGYEISNHARPGEEARHNLVYWRGGDYVGIGPGAHGRLTLGGQRIATETVRAPALWLEHVSRETLPELPREVLSPEDWRAELLLMGLRVAEGVPLARLRRTGAPMLDRVEFEDLVNHGLLEPDAKVLRTTSEGRLLLNGIVERLCRDPAAIPG